jgi:hypothetical protein
MFVCVLCAFILCLPRVEAGKNTSTVIPASRKRRRKGNPVVSNLYILYLCVPCGSRSKRHSLVGLFTVRYGLNPYIPVR